MKGRSDEQETSAEKSLRFCSLFESELLVGLMLRYWGHPLAENEDYNSQLLEMAAEVLSAAATGPANQVFVEGVPATDMNLIAAIWYAECRAIEEADSMNRCELESRKTWLETVRRTLPSCFCAQSDLP